MKHRIRQKKALTFDCMKNTDEKRQSALSKAQQDYMARHFRHHKFVRIARILILFLFLAVWELAADAGWIDSFFFSSPVRVVTCFLTMVREKSLFVHIGVTLLETVASFLLVVLLSLAAATALWYFRGVSEIAEPYLVVLNSLPKSALAPLLTVINLYSGFLQVDPEKLKLVLTLGGSRKDTFSKVVLPASVPVILSNMKVNIGLALVGVIIGEFLAARRGLGYLIIYASQVFQLDMLITSILILCAIAMGLYQLVQMADHRYKKKG